MKSKNLLKQSFAILIIVVAFSVMNTARAQVMEDGTQQHPFLIESASELQDLTTCVNSGVLTFYHNGTTFVTTSSPGSVSIRQGGEKAFFKLTTDLTYNTGNLAGCDGVKDSTWVSWTPIGNLQFHFKGRFDGDGHVVSGIYIDTTGVSGTGFFGIISDSAYVRNLAIVNSYIRGDQYVGGVVGWNVGCEISYCLNAATVEGVQYVGGITGHSNGDELGLDYAEINYCINAGPVTSNNTAGGITSINHSGCGIYYCLNYGVVNSGDRGPLCHTNMGTVWYSSYDDQMATFSEGYHPDEHLDETHANTPTMTNGSWRGELGNSQFTYRAGYYPQLRIFATGHPDISLLAATPIFVGTDVTTDSLCKHIALGGVADAVSWSVNNELRTQINPAADTLRLLAQDAFILSAQLGDYYKAFPLFSMYGSAMGTEDNPFLIYTVEDLVTVRNGVNTGYDFEYQGYNVPAFANNTWFKLMNDLDLNPGETNNYLSWSDTNAPSLSWHSIGASSAIPFKGHFMGAGHTISGLFAEPLFGVIDNNGSVTDLGLGVGQVSTLNYVQDGLLLYLDAIKNQRSGVHSTSTRVWEDLSGHGNDCTLTWTGTTFDENTCLFTGSRYGTIPAPSPWVFGNSEYTIEVVFNDLGSARSGDEGFFAMGSPRGEYYKSFHIMFRNNTFYESWYYCDFAFSANARAAFSTGAFSWNPVTRERKGYLSGVLKQTTVPSCSPNVPQSTVYISANYGAINPGRSPIYAVRVYDHQLTDEEIANNYQADYDRFVRRLYYSASLAYTNKGTITSCFTTLDNAAMVRDNRGTLSHCYSLAQYSENHPIFADLNSGTVESCYYAGTSRKELKMVQNNMGVVQNCYYDSQMAPAISDSLATAKTTAQLATAAEMADLLPATHWTLADGSYPRLNGSANSVAAQVITTPLLLNGSETALRVQSAFTACSSLIEVQWSVAVGVGLTFSGCNAGIDRAGRTVVQAAFSGMVYKTASLVVDSPLPVKDVAQLIRFRDAINSAREFYYSFVDSTFSMMDTADYITEVPALGEGMSFRLVSDLDLNPGETNNYLSWSDTNAPSLSWNSIGESEQISFKGHFMGDGHTISGIYGKSLFGVIADNASVTNLGIGVGYLGHPAGYSSDGLLIHLDGWENTRRGHSSTTSVWENLVSDQYDFQANGYSSRSWGKNCFWGNGSGGRFNCRTSTNWNRLNHIDQPVTVEIVAYLNRNRTSPSYRGVMGYHSGSSGFGCQNDNGSGVVTSIGGMNVSSVNNQIVTLSYAYNYRWLNGVAVGTGWTPVNNSINSNYEVVFGNSYSNSRCWSDTLYALRIYTRKLTDKEVYDNHFTDYFRYTLGVNSFCPCNPSLAQTNKGNITSCFSSLDDAVLVSVNQGTISHCYSVAQYSEVTSIFSLLNQGVVENCYYAGTSRKELNITYNKGGVVQNCYYDSQMAPVMNDSLATAKTTVQLTTAAEMADLLPATHWTLADGYYPRLNSSANTDAALALAAPIRLFGAEDIRRVKNDFTVCAADDEMEWALYEGDGVSVHGCNAEIDKAGKTVLQAFVDGMLYKSATLVVDYPFPVKNAEQLALFRDGINSSDDFYFSFADSTYSLTKTSTHKSVVLPFGELARFEQTADIDMSEEEHWIPIGNVHYGFIGEFDGKLKKIRYLTDTATQNNFALFGSLKGALLKNICLDSCSINGNGKSNVGLLCAYVRKSTIDSCFVTRSNVENRTGTIGGLLAYAENSTFRDCHFNGDITANRGAGIAYSAKNCVFEGCTADGLYKIKDYGAGILVQHSDSTYLRRCTNYATIQNTGSGYMGGIISNAATSPAAFVDLCRNFGTITDTIGTAAALGGISASGGNVTHSANFGLITAPTLVKAGGIIGTGGLAEGCFNSGKITAPNFTHVGGIIGYAGTARFCFNAGEITLKTGSYFGAIGSQSNTGQNCYNIGLINVGNVSNTISATNMRNDRQMCPNFVGSATQLGTKQMVGNALSGQLGDDSKWVFTDGLYPRISGMENEPWSLAAATPVFLDSLQDANGVTSDFRLGTGPAGSTVWSLEEGDALTLTTDSAHIEHWGGVLLGASANDTLYKTVRLGLHDTLYIPNLAEMINFRNCINSGFAFYYDAREGHEHYSLTFDSVFYVQVPPMGRGCNFKLTADIDMDTISSWEPIGNYTGNWVAFKGYFDGGGHSIRNMKIDGGSRSYIGLFGVVNTGNGIANLKVDSAYLTTTGGYVGAVAGFAGSKVRDLYARHCNIEGGSPTGGVLGSLQGVVTAERCFNFYTNVKGTGTVGGVIGHFTNTTTTFVKHKYLANVGGDVNGSGGSLGGVIGHAGRSCEIHNCFNTGSVTTNTASVSWPCVGGIVGLIGVDGNNTSYNYVPIYRCFNTGKVTGPLYYTNTSRTGGILGCAWNDYFSNEYYCYNTGEIVGYNNTHVGGVTGVGYTHYSYNIGKISGGANRGALNGYRDGVTKCFYDSQMMPNSSRNGGAKLTEAMLGSSLANGAMAANVACDSNWVFVDGLYPQLRVFAECEDTLFRYASLASVSPIHLYKDATLTENVKTVNHDFAVEDTVEWSLTRGRGLYFEGDTARLTHEIGTATITAGVNGVGYKDVPLLLSVSEDNPLLIKDVQNLVVFRDAINRGTAFYYNFVDTTFSLGDTCTDDEVWMEVSPLGENFTFKLVADTYNLAGIANWVPIGRVVSTAFKGNFDGNHKIIDSMTITNTSQTYVGLFGMVNPGTLRNIVVANAHVTNTGGHVGAVVGYSYGIIDSCCAVNDTVRAIGSSSNAGGIVGRSDNIVRNCWTTGGLIKGDARADACGVGGIVGTATKSVIHCGNLGATVFGHTYTGGVVGRIYNGQPVEYCCNMGEVTGYDVCAGVAASGGTRVNYCFNTGYVHAQHNGDHDNNECGGVAGEGFTCYYCFNAGKVEGSTVSANATGGIGGTNCTVYYSYNVGEIVGNNAPYAGGVTGSGNVYYSYNAGKVTGGVTQRGAISGSQASPANSWNDVQMCPGLPFNANKDSLTVNMIGGKLAGGKLAANAACDSNWVFEEGMYPQIRYFATTSDTLARNAAIAAATPAIFDTVENVDTFATRLYLAGYDTTLWRVPPGSGYEVVVENDSAFVYQQNAGLCFAYLEATRSGEPYKRVLISNLSEENAVIIKDAEQLSNFRDYINGGGGCFYNRADSTFHTAQVDSLYLELPPLGVDVWFRMSNDIDLSGIADWTPVGTASCMFSGYFSGGHHAVRNMTIADNKRTYAGLFGITKEGKLCNLTVAESHVTNTGGHVGAVVGYNNCLLDSCCAVNDTVRGLNTTTNTGGVVGRAEYHLNRCLSVGGLVSGIGNNSEYGTGGITGRSSQLMTYCYNKGTTVIGSLSTGGIAGSTTNNRVIQYCGNMGNVYGHDGVGGIVGYPRNGNKFMYCFNTGIVSARQAGDASSTEVAGIAMEAECWYCFNSGKIIGSSVSPQYIGGVACSGKVYYSFNVGEIDGYKCNYAGGVIGSGNSYYSYNAGYVHGATARNASISATQASPTNSWNDVQMCPGLPFNANKDSLTVNMIGGKLAGGKLAANAACDSNWVFEEGMYPQIRYFATTADTLARNAARAAATPVFLYKDSLLTEKVTLVLHDFTVNDTVNWRSKDNSGVIVTDSVAHLLPNAVGKATLTASVNGVDYKDVPIFTLMSVIIKDVPNLVEFRNGINSGRVFHYNYADSTFSTGDTCLVEDGWIEIPVGGESYTFCLHDTIFDLSSIASWTPIGTTTYPFKGSFDGRNQPIENMTINGGDYRGLFGVFKGNVIKRVRMVHPKLNSVGSYAGCVCGQSFATIDSCVLVQDTLIATGSYVGGIVGHIVPSKIIRCRNESGYVKGNQQIGGIVGYTQGSSSITYCYNNAYVAGNDDVGGVLGNGHVTIEFCFNSGDVYGTATGATVGGIFGWHASARYCINTGWINGANETGGIGGGSDGSESVTFCINTGIVETWNNYGVGGIMGYAPSTTLNNCYNVGEVRGKTDNTAGISSQNRPVKCFNAARITGVTTGRPVAGNRTSTNCYYDWQMTPNITVTDQSTALTTAEMVGPGSVLKSVLDTVYWIFEEGMYPRLRWTDSLSWARDAALAASAPVTLFTNYAVGDTLIETVNSVLHDFAVNDTVDWRSRNNTGIVIAGDTGHLLSSAVGKARLTASVNGVDYKDVILYLDMNLIIKDVANLVEFRNGVNSGRVFYYNVSDSTFSTGDSCAALDWLEIPVGGKDYTFCLHQNTFDLSSIPSWTPIGTSANNFKGSFDGRGQTIENMRITGNGSYVGFFGVVTSPSIRHLHVDNAKVLSGDRSGCIVGHITGTTLYDCHGNNDTIITQKPYVAGICGVSQTGSTIRSCTLSNSFVNCSSGDNEGMGGICAWAKESTIDSCASINNVIRSTGNRVGGVCGHPQSTNIKNCFTVAGTIQNTGKWTVGGIVGRLTDSYISKCYNDGTVITGVSDVGGIVGTNAGTVDSCWNSGMVTSNGGECIGGIGGCNYVSNIKNSYNFGMVISKASYTGGIAGKGDGNLTILNCINLGEVTGTTYVGGITGANQRSTTNCLNAGQVTGTSYVGGIAAVNTPVSKCLNVGRVRGSSSVGGIDPSGVQLATSLYDLQMSPDMPSSSEAAGYTTQALTGTTSAARSKLGETDWIYEEGMYPRLAWTETAPWARNAALAASAPVFLATQPEVRTVDHVNHGAVLAGYDTIRWSVQKGFYFDVSEQNDTARLDLDPIAGYGVLGVYVQDTLYRSIKMYSMSEECPVIIKSQEEFMKFRQYINDGVVFYFDLRDTTLTTTAIDPDSSYTIAAQGANCYFRLDCDLDLLEYDNWTSVGNTSTKCFKGYFNGNNKTITGLTVTSGDSRGLFGYTIGGGIKNVRMVNIRMEGAGSNWGAVCGYAENATIVGCSAVSGVVSSTGSRIGAICGYCKNDSIAMCCNRIPVTGADAGGVVGYMESGRLRRCYNVGTIRGNDTTTAFNVGGVCGTMASVSATMSDCYNTGNVIGGKAQYAGGLVGQGVAVRAYNIGIVEQGEEGIAQVGGISGSAYCGVGYNNLQFNPYRDMRHREVTTTAMIGTSLQGIFGTDAWVYERDMYPRLKGMDTTVVAIVEATPVKLSGSQQYDMVRSPFTLGMRNGVSWSRYGTGDAFNIDDIATGNVNINYCGFDTVACTLNGYTRLHPLNVDRLELTSFEEHTCGEPYTWEVNHKTYVRSGIYRETFSSVRAGCDSVVTLTLFIPKPMTLAKGYGIISCHGADDGWVEAYVSGGFTRRDGNGPFYSWVEASNPADTLSRDLYLDGLGPGKYIFTVTDSIYRDCFKSDTIVLTEPDELIHQIVTCNSNCYGMNDGTIVLRITGGTSPYTVEWTGAQSGSRVFAGNDDSLYVIDNLADGEYEVTVTDAHHCVTTALPCSFYADSTLYSVQAQSVSKVYDGLESQVSSYELSIGGGVPFVPTLDARGEYMIKDTTLYKDYLHVVVTGAALTNAGSVTNTVDTCEVIRRFTGIDSTADVSCLYNLRQADGAINISKRTVVLTSATRVEGFDNYLQLADSTMIQTGRFAAGDTIYCRNFPVQSGVGTRINTFDTTSVGTVSSDNYDVVLVQGVLTILPSGSNVAVIAPSATKMYDGTPLTATNISWTGLPSDHTVECTLEGTLTDVGSDSNRIVPATVRIYNGEHEDVTSTYPNITLINGVLTVTRRTVSLSSQTASKPYDGTALSRPVLSMTGDGFAPTDISGAVTVVGSITTVGSITNRIVYDTTSSFKRSNYNFSKSEGTLTVTARPVTVVGDSLSVIYDGDMHEVTYFSVNNVAPGQSYTGISYTTGVYDTVGVYPGVFTGTFDVKDGSGNSVLSNYDVAPFVTGRLVIRLRMEQVIITSDSASRAYDGTPLTAENYDVNFGGMLVSRTADGNFVLPVTGDTLRITPMAEELIDAGSTLNSFTYTLQNHNSYPDVQLYPGTLEVTPLHVTLKTASATKQYDATPLTAASVDFLGDQFVEGESIIPTFPSSITEVGTTDNDIQYVFSAGTKAQNYVMDTLRGTLAVTPRNIRIHTASDTITYDGLEHELTTFDPFSIVLGGHEYVADFSDVSTSTGVQTESGDYTNSLVGNLDSLHIYYGGRDYGDQFNPTVVEGVLHIGKDTITVTPDNTDREYGDDNPAFTYVMTGFHGADSEDTLRATGKLTGSVLMATTASTDSLPGSYTINVDVSGLSADNYVFAPGSGTLTVTNRQITVEASSIDVHYDGLCHDWNETPAPHFFISDSTDLVSGHSLSANVTSAQQCTLGSTPVTLSDIVITSGLDTMTAYYDIMSLPGSVTVSGFLGALTIASASAELECNGTVQKREEYIVTFEGDTVSPVADGNGRKFSMPTINHDTLTITPTFAGISTREENVSNNNTFSYVLQNDAQYIGTRDTIFGTITMFDSLKVVVNDTAVTCNGASDGKAKVTITGGKKNAGNYSYRLDSGSETSTTGVANLTNLSDGNHIFYVKDSLDYEKTVTFVITQPDSLTLTLTTDDPVYGDGTIMSYSTGGNGDNKYMLNDTNENNHGVYNHLTAGSYTVKVTDAKGCTASGNVMLTATTVNEIEGVALSGDLTNYAPDTTVSSSGELTRFPSLNVSGDIIEQPELDSMKVNTAGQSVTVQAKVKAVGVATVLEIEVAKDSNFNDLTVMYTHKFTGFTGGWKTCTFDNLPSGTYYVRAKLYNKGGSVVQIPQSPVPSSVTIQ